MVVEAGWHEQESAVCGVGMLIWDDDAEASDYIFLHNKNFDKIAVFTHI